MVQVPPTANAKIIISRARRELARYRLRAERVRLPGNARGRLDLNHPLTAVRGICETSRYARPRLDLNHPLTAEAVKKIVQQDTQEMEYAIEKGAVDKVKVG